MMSVLALTGYALGGLIGSHGGDTPDEDDSFLFGASDMDQPDGFHDILHDESEAETSILEFARGDAVSGFDGATDVLELEYTSALGPPDVTVTDFPDGSGASVAMNGVVVADVAGAQGLDPDNIILIAV